MPENRPILLDCMSGYIGREGEGEGGREGRESGGRREGGRQGEGEDK